MATETVINRPAPFVEEIGKKLSEQALGLQNVPVVTTGVTGISQQPGETAAGFKARQDAARAFTLRQQNLAGLAPQVAGQDALQRQAQSLAQAGVGSFQPALQRAQAQIAGIPTGATVASVNNSTCFTLSADPTLTNTNTSLHFRPADATSWAAGRGTDWAPAGTLTRSTSTLKMTGAGKSLNYLSGEELSHLLIDNSSGTVTASVLTGTNNLTVLSLTVNDSSASFTAPAGTLTITGKNASNYIIDLDGVFVHSSGTVKIDTSLTGDKLLDIIPSSGTGLNNLITNEDGSGVIQYNGNSTIAGNLTVEEGTLHGYDYNNSELTVTGDVTVESGGTLGVSNQTGACSFASLTINSGGTHVATSGTTTITNIESGASRSILNNGTFTHNSGTVLFNGAMDQKVSMDGTGNLHNVTLNKSNNDFVFIDSSTTVEGNLDITMADNTRQCRPSATSGAITVTGDVIVREGILLRAANDCTGAMSFGGLKLESGSIYAATNATTTITNRITGESHLWKNDGGTFTHNNGTVKFNDNDHSAVKENTFYNVEVESNLGDYAVSFEAQGGGGNPFTILNDLTITRGDFELVNANDTCDIHGKTIINGSSNSAARFNNDKNQTATITHHGPVEIHTGTYHEEDGGSVKILSGFRNIGGVVD